MSKIEFNFKDKDIDTLTSVFNMFKGEFEKESLCILRKDRMEIIGVDAEADFRKGSKTPKLNSMLKVTILYSDIFHESEIADYEFPVYIPISTYLEKFRSNLSVAKDSGGGENIFVVTYDEYKEYQIIKSNVYSDMLKQELEEDDELECIYVATKVTIKSKRLEIYIDLLSINMATGALSAHQGRFNSYYNKNEFTCTAKFVIGSDDLKSISNLIKNANSKLSVKDGFIKLNYEPFNPDVINIGNSYFNYHLEVDRDNDDVSVFLDEEFEYIIDSKVINKIQGDSHVIEFYDKNNSIDTALIAKSMVYDSVYVSPTKLSI